MTQQTAEQRREMSKRIAEHIKSQRPDKLKIAGFKKKKNALQFCTNIFNWLAKNVEHTVQVYVGRDSDDTYFVLVWTPLGTVH